MDLIPGITQTASALEVNKQRLEVIAQNIANAHTTLDESGGPYQRQVVSFEAVLNDAKNYGVKIGQITKDVTPGPSVYNPSHPHADEKGMVQMPNVSMTQEMVDMITASRAYEANLSVAKTSRQMAERALEIGR
ncbi:MAG: flagellar basal body rod protein FlgC [Verrucomicrobiae bacterium]|nr:flagellar basal body rod protein FlgC [Verrucomicrobiae bacterium]